MIKDIIDYAMNFPNESSHTDVFQAFLLDSQSLEEPYRIGHITGSAWIIDGSHKYVLLTHHRKLNMWLQLGGHQDVGETALETALREGQEESGLSSLEVFSPHIFDIDAHIIPPRKGEAEHCHFDIRYCFQADRFETLKISSESKDLKWVALSEVASYNKSPSVMRMTQKTKDFIEEMQS